jgi:NitT/TauT family transport system permease protein
MKRFLLAALFFAFLLLIWEALFRAKIWSPVLLPSPRQVAVYLEGAAVDGTLLNATIVTMRRLLIGYIIGLVVGLPLGLLTARWKVLQNTIGTLALGLQTLPSVCLSPLAVVMSQKSDGDFRYPTALRANTKHSIAESMPKNISPIRLSVSIAHCSGEKLSGAT